MKLKLGRWLWEWAVRKIDGRLNAPSSVPTVDADRGEERISNAGPTPVSPPPPRGECWAPAPLGPEDGQFDFAPAVDRLVKP